MRPYSGHNTSTIFVQYLKVSFLINFENESIVMFENGFYINYRYRGIQLLTHLVDTPAARYEKLLFMEKNEKDS